MKNQLTACRGGIYRFRDGSKPDLSPFQLFQGFDELFQ
jgi:hypothetical protein